MSDPESGKRERLAQLEATFEAAGGRGVELADEIDRLREELEPEIGDRDYIEAAIREYASDDVVVQTEGPGAPPGIVDRIPGAAWVMAWLYVSDEVV